MDKKMWNKKQSLSLPLLAKVLVKENVRADITIALNLDFTQNKVQFQFLRLLPNKWLLLG